MAHSDDPRRQLPSVDALLQRPELQAFADVSQEYVVAVIRRVLTEARDRIEAGKSAPGVDDLVRSITQSLAALLKSRPERVVNATGVILHTGLGRAALGSDAVHALIEASGYSQVEFQLESGDRGDRQIACEGLLRVLTGAESALVVNNNAAAIYLTLNTLAHRREVVVSRGQLIEIGGSFRLPDIMVRSGVRLVEVGTTNRTRLADYRDAISAGTALLMLAHTSNYRIEGFTESVSIDELVTLGKLSSVPVVDDIGNGLLWDWSPLGLPYEPNVAASLAAGADLVLFSGDKVLGGPQAGIILGRRDLVARLKKSPLARVLRPDKLTLAALNATLRAYLDRRTLAEKLPVWSMLTTSQEMLLARAQRLYARMKPLAAWTTLEISESEAEAGSGTLPAFAMKSVALRTLPKGVSAASWARRLRTAPIPVVGTVRQDVVWLDMRTLSSSTDEDALVGTVEHLFQRS